MQIEFNAFGSDFKINMFPIVKRRHAAATGDSQYFTGKPCPNGHFSFRYVSSNGCSQCVKDAHSIWRVKNKDKMHLKDAKWRKNNPQKVRELRKKWAKNNPEKNKQVIKAAQKKWDKNNKEKKAATIKKWWSENPEYGAAASAQRRAVKKNATLNGINVNEIKHIYRKCREITKKTGIEHHVDHIIPLQNNKVCGLHVPWNLQIITAEQNLLKSNNFDG